METFLLNLCEKYASHKNFSGVCRLERERTVLFERGYGFANKAYQIPNTDQTIFDTASITKVFTAAAILQLIEQGLFLFTDPITSLVDLKGTCIPEDVTVEQLLNHTSGIADDADEEAGESYSALFIDSPNYALRECKDFLKNFAYKKPNFKAGTAQRYCNCSYILLGLAIEAVTGLPYREYVRRNIFEKAGMTHTKFCAMDEITPNAAEGYRSKLGPGGKVIGYQKNIYCYPPIGTPDGGAYTNGNDLSLFLYGILNHTLLPEKYAEILLQPHSPFRTSVDIGIPNLSKVNGYAFEFLQAGDQNFCIYKDGFNDGVAGIFCYYPETKHLLTILANQDCNVWSMQREIQLKLYHEYYQ